MKIPALRFTADNFKYANLASVQNRLSLLECLTLSVRQKLDAHSLSSMPKLTDPIKNSFQFVRKTRLVPGLPDFPCIENEHCTMNVSFETLSQGLNKAQQKALILLLANRYDNLTGTVTISCSRFPFYKQNQRWILDRVRELIAFATSDESLKITESLREDLFWKPAVKVPKYSFERVIGQIN